MSLTSGQLLSFYEVLAPLGAGAMGEVYRARDTRLEREVAIKVLPEHFAEDEERLQRFEREAKTLAALNHPNVAGIHGIDQVGDTCFLAMELVPGEDLAERLGRGPMRVEESLDLARQIAEGLEAAHEAGIVHRDLKPANVRVTPEGVVKILDFGLAKPMKHGAAETRGGERGVPETSGGAQSDSFLVTSEGVVLGTPTYMSPEQARGRLVDRRTDIWAFGCVLYECLAGRRPFEGEVFGDLVAAILEHEPDMGALPRATPSSVRTLVARCLTKDPRRRLRDAGEARLVLEGPLDQPAADVAGATQSASRVPWIVAGLAVLAAAIALMLSGGAWRGAAEPKAPLLRSRIGFVPGLEADPEFNLAVLSGGHRVLYCGGDGEEVQMYLRSLSEVRSRTIGGTQNAYLVGASPDEQWFAFIADGLLKKVSANGGDPIVLADATMEGRGGHWADDGFIYYTPGTVHPIMRVPEEGGEAEVVTELVGVGSDGVRDSSHRYPTLLPGGKALLYLAGSSGDFAGARIEARILETGEVRVLQTGAVWPLYLDGHLGFYRDETFYVQGFDVESLSLTTPPVVALEDVYDSMGSGSVYISVSDNGTMLYVPGDGAGARDFELGWAGADGELTRLAGPDALYQPRISPDGLRIAYTVGHGAESDVWVHEVETGQDTRLTLDSRAKDSMSAWSPDSRRIAFASNRAGGAMNLYVKPADGSGEAVRLTEGALDQFPTSWSPDGSTLLFMEKTVDRAVDLYSVRLDADARAVGEPEVFESSLSHDVHASFSPDGEFVAYSAGESGAFSVYVRSLDGAARWQVTDGMGWAPRWDEDGRLYYQTWSDDPWQGQADVCVVDFQVEDGSRAIGRPRRVGSSMVKINRLTSATFDVHPIDGRPLVVAPPRLRLDVRQHPVLIQGWLEEVAERVEQARPERD